jgi:hypothetical protein
MEKYEIFEDYVEKSKNIRQFCEQNETLLFEALRMDIGSDAITKYINGVGKEIDEVLAYIDKLKSERESHIAALIKHC